MVIYQLWLARDEPMIEDLTKQLGFLFVLEE
jgi:hypothetical protein